jgi:hypothetical protein
MDTRPDGGDDAMEQRHERLVEEIRMAERARELLAGLEWRLKNRDRADLENHLRQLDRLAGSLPEGHVVRLVVENAAAHARTRGAGKAGSVASRSRSKIEGRISTLRGILDRQDAFAGMDA